MKPQPLRGHAQILTSPFQISGSLVLRIRAIEDGGAPPRSSDAAIVFSASEMSTAVKQGFDTLVVFGSPDWAAQHARLRIISIDETLNHLTNGDIVALRADTLRVIYQQQSRHNWFLVTEQCNHFCLMCSQPPKNQDDSYLLDELAQVINLLPTNIKNIGFTGGEPLLYGNRFIDLIRALGERLPDTFVHVLTNGRAFADNKIVNAWASLGHKRLSAGIPLYSSVDYLHDHVVQSKGAWDETLMGILRLKNMKQRVELRIVLHSLTKKRLSETCYWIARNLPFVDHIALMGLENTGFTIANANELWVDPIDYRSELAEGVELLVQSGLRVSIFNLPLCLLEERVRAYAVKSISEWKNAFLEECGTCKRKADCAGFFSSGRPRVSRGIAPLAN